MRPNPLPQAVPLLLLLGALSHAGEPPAPDKPTFWVIPHTHWEGAVFKTREEYLEMGLPNLLKAIRLLKEQPSYRYTIDQVAYIRPFLERYPEEEPSFRRFIAEGRLQLVGGLDVMPDVNMPGGETFIRQIQYGKGYLKERLGVDVTTGWLIDTFGHHAQLPQLLSLGGFKTFWFVRGVPRQEFPAEFFWEGIDGTRIPSFYLPQSYAVLYPTPKDDATFRTFARRRFKSLDPNARGMNRVGVSAADVSEPEEHQAIRIDAFNKSGNEPFVMRLAVPADYEAVIAGRADRPVFKGELNPIFQGTYSTRIELKTWMRSMEQKLLTAEKLAALASWLGGARVDRSALLRAWEPVLFNETHDLASGVMTDHVYEDTVDSYQFSRRLADEQIATGLGNLADRIDTRGQGGPLLVFNSLGWTRTDIAEVDLGFGQPGVHRVGLLDESGNAVPVQIVEKSHYADGGLKTARVAFLAREIPPIGYRTYHFVPEPSSATDDSSVQEPNFLENDLYKVSFDRSTGAITAIRDKQAGAEVLSGPGNVVARQQDRGDFWELYHGLDGASRVAMTTRQPVPARGQATFSDEERAAPGTLRHGPVFSEFRVAHRFGTGQFATQVRVVSGLRRIEITTRLLNNEKYVRYQVLFPTVFDGGRRTDEIPFGAIERPEGIEFPAQNWVDLGDGRRGLAVLNVGLPGHVVSGRTLMISLLRAHGLGAYGFGGGYEPGMSAESGFQLGRERTMRYALVPHQGDWRQARIYREGLEFNHPLICHKVTAHPGLLPPRWGLLEVSHPELVVSALEPGRLGEIVLRIYEASGQGCKAARITLKEQLKEVAVTDLLGVDKAQISPVNNTFAMDLHPFEIKTLRLKRSDR